MVDLSGVQQAVQKIAEQTVQDQAKAGSAKQNAPSADDVQKLQEALNRPPAEANAAQDPSAAQGVEKVGEVKQLQGTSPGDKILSAVHNMRTGFQETMKQLETTVANSAASPADMLKVQMKLQQVTLQQDLMGKVVSKSQQNVDTLLKGQ